jgi:uncharacterized membrane protein (DUF106 family)
MSIGGRIMETTFTLDTKPKTDAEYEAMVDHDLSRLKQMQQQMDNDQQEIESLRAETDAIITDIMRTLKVA